MHLRNNAPWPIPQNADHQVQLKNGYHQVKYTWEKDDWRYEARWHERTPNAELAPRLCSPRERLWPNSGTAACGNMGWGPLGISQSGAVCGSPLSSRVCNAS